MSAEPPPSNAARRQDLILEGELHPTPEQIATLLDRSASPSHELELRAHLSACRRCFGLYTEMATNELAWRWSRHEGAVPEDLIAAGKELADLPEPAKRARSAPLVRSGALVAAAAAILIASVLLLPGVIRQGSDRATVSRAVAEASRAGMVLAADIAQPGPAWRSGSVASTALERALNDLARDYENPAASEETAYWLAAGMLAGRDPNARTLIDDAMRRFPKSTRLMNLAAVAAYRDGQVQEAERILEEILEGRPGDVVALFNRALLLREQGQIDEASRLWDELSRLDPASPIGMRVEAELGAAPRP